MSPKHSKPEEKHTTHTRTKLLKTKDKNKIAKQPEERRYMTYEGTKTYVKKFNKLNEMNKFIEREIIEIDTNLNRPKFDFFKK